MEIKDLMMDKAIHSDFLIHWTGARDIDQIKHPDWYGGKDSTTDELVTSLYLERILNTFKYGLWLTEEDVLTLTFGAETIDVPTIPRISFTELKISQARGHANKYGRFGIGVKRPFVVQRFGRPVIYFAYGKDNPNDIFLKACVDDLKNRELLNFFKPMNSDSKVLNYNFYSASEWRIIYLDKLLENRKILDPRDPKNTQEHDYFNSLSGELQNKLKYLMPLDGWLSFIIYPSLAVKNAAQQNPSNGIQKEIKRIKQSSIEGGNWPIEVDLDACRNF